MSAKLELTIRGLLKYCEEAADEDNTDWRIKKYIKALDELLADLELFGNEESNIETYKQRTADLKKLINYKEPVNENKSNNVGDVMKEIRTIKNAKAHHELRKELFGAENTGLRQRAGTGAGETNLDEAVKHYSSLQEKLAEDMLLLTRNLKDQTITANQIIKKDTETVEKSTKLTDKNFDLLQKESTKLQEHSKRAWKCWMWLMIAVVLIVFLTMVMFMKVTKKRTS